MVKRVDITGGITGELIIPKGVTSETQWPYGKSKYKDPPKELLTQMDEFFEWCDGLDEEERPLLADGFEYALIGYAEICNNVVACYDERKCIEILMKRDGMSYDGAREYFDFNVKQAFVGPKTPAFLTRFPRY